MPIFQLADDLSFPPVELASKSGLLAVGGDLSPDRLILSYQKGIFPWYSEGEPILWWSPDPRFVLFPEEIYISRSMRQVLKKGIFRITYDQSFREVIENCRQSRREKNGSWITEDMLHAYCRLYELGFAHSVEAWMEGELAGGLYGVSFGRCFFGESMFTRMSNASKTALLNLVSAIRELGFAVVDCQVYTDHLLSLGARMISRKEYLDILAANVFQPTLRGNWGEMEVGLLNSA
jgi:leucyl/phenylalanyl-tRNA---protein transferase